MQKICADIKAIKDELAIERLEDKYEIDFPDEFKSFFKYNNGGIPKKNVFEVKGKEYEVRCFLSFNENEYNSIKSPLASFLEETKGRIVPAAKDSGDNYYCLNIETGKVYFWNKDDGLYYCIAENFNEFIGYLE